MNFSDINYNLFKSFIAVFETKKITQAAKDLNFTQSAMSKNIRELEKQLGVKLFANKARGVEATTEATELYNLVISAFVSIENAKNQITKLDSESTGTIRFSAPSYIANSTLIDYLVEFNKKYPKIKLIAGDWPRDISTEKLSKRDIDVYIHYLPIEDKNNAFITTSLREYSHVFYATKNFIEKNNLDTTLTKKDLETLPIIVPFRTFKSTRVLMEGLKNVNLNITLETVTSELTYAMVLKDMGIGFCVESFFNEFPNAKIVKLNTTYELPIVTLAVTHNKDNVSKLVLAFVEGLKEFFHR